MFDLNTTAIKGFLQIPRRHRSQDWERRVRNDCPLSRLWLSEGRQSLDPRVGEGFNLTIPAANKIECKVSNFKGQPGHSS